MIFLGLLQLILAVTEPTHPPTCELALRSYTSIEEVPTPFERVPLQVQIADADMRVILARSGATGFTFERVPEKELTKKEKRAMRSSGIKELYRTVGVFVASDSARVNGTCRRIASGKF